MANFSKGKDSTKLVVTDEIIEYVWAKYGNKWQVDDTMADVILDDLLQKEFNEHERMKDDKGKGIEKDDKGKLTGIKCVDNLEKKIQNVEKILYKAKEKMLMENGKMVLTKIYTKICYSVKVQRVMNPVEDVRAQRGVFIEREMISTKDSGSKIGLEEIQESVDEEPIVNTDTQREVVIPIKPDDISLPVHRTSGRVSKPPQFYYGFHIKEDKISDSILSEFDKPANYKEANASLRLLSGRKI
nr:hypothetical protein [Tanacetum cinerariifolium]